MSLNTLDQYTCACEMMTQGLHPEAFTIFSSIKQSLKTESETVFHWISGLALVCSFEKNKSGPVDAFYYLGTTDQAEKTYFHQEFLLCRYLLVNSLNQIISGQTPIEDFLQIRLKFDKLLYLFEKPSKDLLQVLKFWRDLSGLVAMVLCCMEKGENFSSLVSKFYSFFAGTVNEDIRSPQHLGRVVLEYPVKYPRQFFRFDSPISLNLQINCSSSVKVNRGNEFILEVAVNVKKTHCGGPKVMVSFKGMNNLGKDEVLQQRVSSFNSAGVCNFNIPVVLDFPGVFQFRVQASALNEFGREIGKPEYSMVTFECI
jgi:hypothetical protein